MVLTKQEFKMFLKKSNLTQKEVADKINYHHKHISYCYCKIGFSKKISKALVRAYPNILINVLSVDKFKSLFLK